RLGARVRFVGRIGTDDLVLRSLEREGVDVSGVVRDEGETGVALVVVDASGENLIVVAPGANARLRAEDVHVGESDAVMCQVETVDGTGAGDAFCAALVVSLLEGRDRVEALVRACAAGALAASRPGAQPSLPTARELEEIVAS